MNVAHMARALDLARGNLGKTAPNPSVGCVIARGAAVLAEGVTGAGGRPHAEEQALAHCDAAGADVYVTLEPCAVRSAGAPSCTDRLIKANVARVFVGSRDPHPRANGVGLARLEAAGVTVTSGVLWAEADAVNAGFFLVVREGRPLVGASTDGAGFDAPFAPFADEDMVAALRRHASAGLTRVFVPPGGALAQALAARGLLSGSGQG